MHFYTVGSCQYSVISALSDSMYVQFWLFDSMRGAGRLLIFASLVSIWYLLLKKCVQAAGAQGEWGHQPEEAVAGQQHLQEAEEERAAA